MTLYLKTGANTYVQWTGQPINGVLHPLSIETIWNSTDLNSLGLYSPINSDPVPDGYYVVSTDVKKIGGVAKYINILSSETVNMVSDAANSAHLTIVGLTNELTSSILNYYPDGEKQLWLQKEEESRSFLSLPANTRTANDAPILQAVTITQYGAGIDSANLIARITDKANTVVAKADQWVQISTFVEGFRSKYDVLIFSAPTINSLSTIVSTATQEMALTRQALGM